MLEHKVRFPLGIVKVSLNRQGLGLAERGGFNAEWAVENINVLDKASYQTIAKKHLKAVYLQQEKIAPPKITLNLASHQLMDDIEGWTKLNYDKK